MMGAIMKRLVIVAGLLVASTLHTFAGGRGVPGVNELCAKRWGDDFVMQQACQKEQEDAFFEMFANNVVSENSPTIQKILKFCKKRWTDKRGLQDYVMINSCTEEQAKAYYEMNLKKD